MNKKAKGNTNQRIFTKYLRFCGWEAEVVKNTAWDHSDFFDVGDILAHNKQQWLIVQVKTNTTAGAIKKMKAKVFPPGTLKYVAVRYDGNRRKPVRWRVIDAETEDCFELTETDGVINL